jgi:hypothetical protein
MLRTATATAAHTVAVAVAVVLVMIAPHASAHPAFEEWTRITVAPYAEQVANLDGKSQAEYLSPPGEYDLIYLRHRANGYY